MIPEADLLNYDKTLEISVLQTGKPIARFLPDTAQLTRSTWFTMQVS
jgi:hypothetical protein